MALWWSGLASVMSLRLAFAHSLLKHASHDRRNASAARTGSRVMNSGRCLLSLEFGDRGPAYAAPNQRRLKGSTCRSLTCTCAPNDLVRRIHAKAMPVILSSQDEYDQWLAAPAPEALKLQRPLPNELLQIVATGEKEDALAA